MTVRIINGGTTPAIEMVDLWAIAVSTASTYLTMAHEHISLEHDARVNGFGIGSAYHSDRAGQLIQRSREIMRPFRAAIGLRTEREISAVGQPWYLGGPRWADVENEDYRCDDCEHWMSYHIVQNGYVTLCPTSRLYWVTARALEAKASHAQPFVRCNCLAIIAIATRVKPVRPRRK